MKDVNGKTAFVTGGASGIGLGIAKAFYTAGCNLVLADVRADHLESAAAFFNAPDRVLCLELDVTDRAAYARAAEAAEQKFGKLHLLFNNAGIGVAGPLKQLGFDDWDWGLGVMIGGVVNGLQIVLPYLLKHGEGGHIVNTSSMSALVPIATSSIYSAAKSAILGLSESIRGELAPDHIGVSVFCPGPVQSNIRETGKLRPEKYKRDSGLLEAEERLSRRANPSSWMTPEECGERVLRGVENDDLYILTHPEFKPGAEEHFAAILASFPDEPLNEKRAKTIAFLLRNPIFGDITKR